jgi:aspartyl-tRNA(Asn)/glutamyl-tRNA(Gln) amidotransferase subunit C
MVLDRSHVEHLAALARIGLTEEETETLRVQLAHILEQFEVLRQLDTTGVTFDAQEGQHAPGMDLMRDDVPGASLDSEEVLSNAPRREGDFFRVKAVLEE